MTAWRQVIELSIEEDDLAKLVSITRSRTEPASRVERVRMLLAYREDPSFFAVGRSLGMHHQTVQRCVERALAYGPMAALDDRPRPGKEPTITAEAKAWLVSLADQFEKPYSKPVPIIQPVSVLLIAAIIKVPDSGTKEEPVYPTRVNAATPYWRMLDASSSPSATTQNFATTRTFSLRCAAARVFRRQGHGEAPRPNRGGAPKPPHHPW
jgi:hypothetical protein